MIEVIGVTKKFRDVTALNGVSFAVEPGTVHGLLGHNGAGKTTLVNILSTTTAPTAGTARVCGYDTVADDHEVRCRIGLTGQFTAIDEQLTGFDNLVLVARLLGAPKRVALARADELLDVFDLTSVGKRRVAVYSGGMRRRLDLAMSLLGTPEVLFLDEPTTGLDPVNRATLWRYVKDLVRGGTTVLLTTQYLEEADHLADGITVLGGGRVIASGSPRTLKTRLGRQVAVIVTRTHDEARLLVRSLSAAGFADSSLARADRVVAPLSDSAALLHVARVLDGHGITPLDITVDEPRLEDVYHMLVR